MGVNTHKEGLHMISVNGHNIKKISLSEISSFEGGKLHEQFVHQSFEGPKEWGVQCHPPPRHIPRYCQISLAMRKHQGILGACWFGYATVFFFAMGP